MPSTAELIGVYSLSVDDALLAAQAQELYGKNPSPTQIDRVREQLQSAVLVEVHIKNADTKFDAGKFVQEDPTLPQDSWQVAWAEAYLTSDGQQLLVKRWSSRPNDQTDFRIAFYIHYWKVDRPLRSSYGPLPALAPSPMPERLKRLVPYIEVD